MQFIRLDWRTINSLNRNLDGLIIRSKSLAAISGPQHGRSPARLCPQRLRESHPLQGNLFVLKMLSEKVKFSEISTFLSQRYHHPSPLVIEI